MFYQKIDLLLQQGRYADGEVAIRERLRESMEDPMLFVLLSIALRGREKYRDSEDAAREAIALDPDFDMAWWSLGQSQLERHERKAALESVEKALAIDPYDSNYFALKARILSESNRESDGLEAAEAGLAIDPECDNCRFFRSILLARLGRHDEADDESSVLLADDPEDAANHAARGWVMVQRGDGRGAQQHFIEALRIDPESEDAREGLAFSLKLSNPVLGFALRLLIQLERIPLVPAMIGTVLLLQLCDKLMESDYPAPLPQIGIGLRSALVLFFVISLAINPLFDLVLFASRRTRHALSGERVRAMKWCLVPLVLGVLLLILWVVGGARSLPYHSAAWFAVARMISEAFDTANDWARRRMHAVSIVAAAVACWVLFAGVILAPQWIREMTTNASAMMEKVEALKEASKKGRDTQSEEAGESDAKAKEGHSPEVVEARLEIADLLRSSMRKVRYAIVYPVLAVWLLSAFADNLGNWLTRRAPR